MKHDLDKEVRRLRKAQKRHTHLLAKSRNDLTPSELKQLKGLSSQFFSVAAWDQLAKEEESGA